MSEIEQPIARRFASIAARYGDKVAVEDGIQSWTYNQLHAFSAALAQTIQQRVAPGEPVAIALPNGVRYPGAILACLAAGYPCVPLDFSEDPAASRSILAASGTKAVITGPEDSRFANDPAYTCIPALATRQAPDLTFTATPESVAYVLYTSGTSGPRKGVFQSQRNLLHDVFQYVNSAHLSAHDHLTNLYAPHAIGAWRDLFGALLTGATLHTIDLRTHGFSRLRHLLENGEITVLHSMPPLLRSFFRSLSPPGRFESLRLIYAAGDRLFRQDVEMAWPHLPENCAFYTGLGSTECSTLFRQCFISRDTALHDDLVPVGYAIEDSESLVVGENGETVAPGELGELVVASRYLALGYWRDPELTAARFQITGSGLTCFRTGDFGWESDDGLLHFAGRKDDQVKVRGTRVYIAALESRLRSCPSIADAVVVPYERNLDQQLAGFIVPAANAFESQIKAEFNQTELKGLLSQMNLLEQIPLLPNGKRDIPSLRVAASAANLTTHENCPAALETVAGILADAWKTLPAAASVPSAETTWEQSGGDSLSMLELLMRLEQAVSRRLPAEWFTPQATQLSLKSQVDELLPCLSQPVPELSSNPDTATFLLPGAGGADLSLLRFARSIETLSHVEILHFPDSRLTPLANQKFESILAQFAAKIAQTPDATAIQLIGFSFGARFALELASLLQARGRTVPTIIVIDAPPAGVAHAHRRRGHIWRALRRRFKNPRSVLLTIRNRCLAALVFARLPGLHWIENLYGHPTRSAVASTVRLRTALGRYLPRFEGSLILVRSDDPTWKSLPLDLGWSHYCAEVHVIATNSPSHSEILSSPELYLNLKQLLAHPPEVSSVWANPR
jgi:acyl-coenzyme A synthetase/AMP-(fatty) acid ligase/thioesterase domain-containing protein/acyl carrier protein